MSVSKRTNKHLSQIILLIVAVVVVIGGSIGFQYWWNSRPEDPQDVRVSFAGPGRTEHLTPISICEFGKDCSTEQPVVFEVTDDDEITVTVPKEVSRHDWTLLAIYDQPEASDEMYFKGGEQSKVIVPGSLDPMQADAPRPKLLVIEVHSVLLGNDADGADTPLAVAWAVHTSNDPTPLTDALERQQADSSTSSQPSPTTSEPSTSPSEPSTTTPPNP